MNLLDILIIIIIAATCIQGYIKGFVSSFISFGGFIIAGFLAFKFSPLMTDFLLEKTAIYHKITEILNNRAPELFSAPSDTPVTTLNLPSILAENLSHSASTQDTLGGVVAIILINVLSVLIIFIGVKILLFIIGIILNSLTELPIIKQVNKLGGIAFGFIKGGILVFVLLALLVPVIGITENKWIIDMISQSYIGSIMYHNNIILLLTKAYL